MFSAPDIHPIILLVLLCFSPYGPAELQDGASWSYRSPDAAEVATMRIVAVSPEGEGLEVRARMFTGNETVPLRVHLSPDRRTVTLGLGLEDLDRPGRDTHTFHMPEFAPGVTWQLPGEDPLTVTAVEAVPLSIGAGDYPEAVKVSLGAEDIGEVAIWLVPQVGLVAVDDHGERALELLQYSQVGVQRRAPRDQPLRQPPLMQPAAPPVVTALDANTFVVADPMTSTVTVYHVVRSDTGEWRLESKARASYGRPLRAAAPE